MNPKSIRAHRIACGWSLPDIAAALNISLRKYQNLESGRTLPSKAMLEQLARCFHVEVSNIALTPKKTYFLDAREARLLDAYRRLSPEEQSILDLFLERR